MDGIEGAAWYASAVALGSAVFAWFGAMDARKAADRAQRTNDALLALQERADKRRTQEDATRRQAEDVVAQARQQWPEYRLSCFRSEGALRSNEPHSVNSAVSESLQRGIVVRSGRAGEYDVAVAICHMRGVGSATAEADGYLVRMDFDPETHHLRA